MKISDIKEGQTYRNRGRGSTERKVLAISARDRPKRWYSDTIPPNELGVKYIVLRGRNTGEVGNLYVSSFAKWCGSVV